MADPLVSTTQATVLSALRRALATANAVAIFTTSRRRSNALKRNNLDGGLEAREKG